MNTDAREKLKYRLFGSEWGKERKIYLDYARILATIFVVCTHVLALAKLQMLSGTIEYKVTEIFNFLFLSCNLLFVMISGALLLPVQGERLRDFFVKRFSKVAIPFVLYYVVYVCAKEGLQCLYPSYWLTFLQRILSGAPVEAPHFWLIYVILGLYILTPFLRYLVQNIPDNVLTGVMVVVFLVNALDTYLPLFGRDAHLSVVVDSYVGVFLLGYYISERCSRRAENIIMAGGVASFGITCYIICCHDCYDSYIYNNAPTMMLFAAALVIGCRRLAMHIRYEGLIVRLLSRYSFSILLIHWAVLHVAVKQILKVDVMSGGVVGGFLLMSVLTLFLSLVGGMVIEHLVLVPLQRLFVKCFSSREKKGKKI